MTTNDPPKPAPYGELRLGPGVLDEVAGCHTAAADQLASAAARAPGGIDAGLAGPYLDELVSRVVAPARDLADLHAALAALLRAVARGLAQTDRDVDSAFDAVRAVLR